MKQIDTVGARIIIGGDIYPSDDNLLYFVNGDAENVFHNLIDDFKSADLNIVNLECPLTDQNCPISKSGPAIKAPPECAQTIKNANIHVVNLVT